MLRLSGRDGMLAICCALASVVGLSLFNTIAAGEPFAATVFGDRQDAKVSPAVTGQLVWRGHWFSGGVSVEADSVTGTLSVLADSLDHQSLVGLKRRTRMVGRAAPAGGLSAQTAEAPLLPPSQYAAIASYYEYKARATPTYVRMRRRNVGLRQVADSLQVLSRMFSGAIDSVTVSEYGYTVNLHDIPAPWHVGVSLSSTARPKASDAEVTVQAAALSLAHDINAHLEKGQIVFLPRPGTLVIVPPGFVGEIKDQLDALRAGRVPRTAVLSDSTVLRQLLDPPSLLFEETK